VCASVRVDLLHPVHFWLFEHACSPPVFVIVAIENQATTDATSASASQRSVHCESSGLELEDLECKRVRNLLEAGHFTALLIERMPGRLA